MQKQFFFKIKYLICKYFVHMYIYIYFDVYILFE